MNSLKTIVNANLLEREQNVTLSLDGIRLVAAELGITNVSGIKGTHQADITLACDHAKRYRGPKSADCVAAGLIMD